MKYYDVVGATRADGTPFPREGLEMRMLRVSEWSLRELREVFGRGGVTLKTEYVCTVSDAPVWRVDEVSGRLVHL